MRISDWSSDVCSTDLGQRKARREMEVALDAEPAGQADGFDFRQAERAKFRAAETKVGQSEQRVAVFVQFARQPCRRAHRIEEFDHGQRVGFALDVSLRGDPGNIVGAQGGVDFGGQEDHAAALRSVSVVSDSSASPKARTKSAALLARLAARKIARLSSRKTSSHDPT